MCFLVILMGCTNRKVSREFSDTMKDGSRVVIKIEYKPKSLMNSKGEKLGSYYFIVKHFFRPGKNVEAEPVMKKNPIDLKFKKNLGKEVETEPARAHPDTADEEPRFPVGKEVETEPARAPRVPVDPYQKIINELRSKNVGPAPAPLYISFYDREGHLLLKSFSPDGYTINLANLEKNTFDGGIEWKGQFDERIITVENFRDIHSITAQSR